MVTIPTRPRVDLTMPRTLRTIELNTARRGYDRDEVRAVLDQVADELERLREQNQRLSEELADARAMPAIELDEATVAALLGEETARVLATAKEAAGQIRERAEEGVERLRRDAHDDAARLREDAALEAARIRGDAVADAEAEIDASKAEGREMVAEARAVRERMLTDLARRRDAVRGQLQRLRADRDRLVASFEDAGRAVDDVLTELRDVVPPREPLDAETVEEAAAAVAALGPASPAEPAEAAEAAGGVVLELVPEDADGAETAEDADGTEPAESTAFHLGEEPAVPEPALSYAGELDTSGARSDVDDLFARIRAAGPAEVAADAQHQPAAQENDEPPAEDEAAADPVDDGDEVDTDYFTERADALGPVQASVARHVKRALNDEQNEVLDALRRASAPGAVDALVGVPAEHGARYRRVLTPDLRTAALVGVRSVGGTDDPSDAAMDAILDEIDVELVTPLRERLAKAIEDAA